MSAKSESSFERILGMTSSELMYSSRGTEGISATLNESPNTFIYAEATIFPISASTEFLKCSISSSFIHLSATFLVINNVSDDESIR